MTTSYRQLLVCTALCATTALSACSQGHSPETQAETSIKLVTITKDDVTLSVAPEMGGSIETLKWRDFDIFRPTQPNPERAGHMSYFPMTPIVNRIQDAKFAFEDKDIDLTSEPAVDDHFVHGHGWLNEWEVIEQTDRSLKIRYAHTPTAWPWSYHTDQTFTLLDSGLRIELSVTNTSDSNMPADLGFHPFFSTTPESILTFQHEGHWLNTGWGVAITKMSGPYRHDYRKGASLYDTNMTDNAHYGWDGRATLTTPGKPDIILTGSPELEHLHVYFPPYGDFAAIEPQHGRSDPFNHFPKDESYIKVLSPNETWSIWMEVKAEENIVE